MSELFEQTKTYVLGDPELDLIGDRDKLAQWRHKNMGPPFYRLGRKIIYRSRFNARRITGQKSDSGQARVSYSGVVAGSGLSGVSSRREIACRSIIRCTFGRSLPRCSFRRRS